MEELRKICQAPIMSRACWYERILIRPLCVRITWLLAPTRISANSVTFAWLSLVLLSAFLFSTGDYLAGVIGGLLVQLVFVLDGVDGELARFRGPTKRGDRFEAISHVIGYSIIPLSFGFGLYTASENLILLAFGFGGTYFYLQAQIQQVETERLQIAHAVNGQALIARPGQETSHPTTSLLSKAVERIQKLVPVYPTTITLATLLNVTCLWVVSFFVAFLGVWMVWIGRHLSVASRLDDQDELG